MKTKSRRLALLMNAFAMPGMGQAYLGRKFSGALWMVLTLLFMAGGLIRYMSVLFDLMARTQASARPISFNPFPLMKQAWVADQQVLIFFLLGLFLVWLLAILDLIWKK